MSLWRPAATALAILLLAGPALAEECPKGKVRGGKGEWVLALSWQPAWCETQSGDRRARPECLLDYRGTEGLTLHGLWPQWGEYCQSDLCGRDRCALPPVPGVASEDLVSVMPGALSRLDRHEWAKHGTCSGLAPRAYFRTATELVRAARASRLGRLLGERMGARVKRGELCDAFGRDFGEDRRGALSFDLEKRGRDLYLAEVRVRMVGDVPGWDKASIPVGRQGDCMRPDDREFLVDRSGFQTGQTPNEVRPICR
ncbi:MAG: hypothetical protein H7841_04340 [Magnetospirillum sp. WYHS-4]